MSALIDYISGKTDGEEARRAAQVEHERIHLPPCEWSYVTDAKGRCWINGRDPGPDTLCIRITEADRRRLIGGGCCERSGNVAGNVRNVCQRF